MSSLILPDNDLLLPDNDLLLPDNKLPESQQVILSEDDYIVDEREISPSWGNKLPNTFAEDIQSIWKPMYGHHLQLDAFWGSVYRKYQTVLLECGRGSGKTEYALRWLVLSLALDWGEPNPIFFYVSPTIAQTKRIGWKKLKQMIPREWIIQKLETEMYIKTVFGSELYAAGGDKPQRLEGTQYQGGVIDEASDQNPDLWKLSLSPAMTKRHKPWLWKIGVPKRVGIGARDFQEHFDKIAAGLVPNAVAYNWPSADIVEVTNPGILAIREAELPKKDFDEQYRAQRVKAGGAVYYEFSKDIHVRNDVLQWNPDWPLIVSMDFNVTPMSWIIGHFYHGHFHVFDEISMSDTHTEETLRELHNRYGKHRGLVSFYGDAASHQRRSESPVANYVIIQNFDGFQNKELCILDFNPSVVNRHAVVNAALKVRPNGLPGIIIGPKCTNLIADLQYQGYKKDSNIVDESDPLLGHMADALGYFAWVEFPQELLGNTHEARIAIKRHRAA